MLKQMRDSIAEDGRIFIALVLPYAPLVERG